MNGQRRTLLAIALVGLVACATVFGTSQPKQPGHEIRMSHAVHKDLPCEYCHEGVASAVAVTDGLRPAESKCLECHVDKKEGGECGFCHTDKDRPATYPRQSHEILFSHKAHLSRTKSDCSVCHKQLSEFTKPGITPPTMAACAACHAESIEQGLCGKCHLDLKKYPLKPITILSHSGNFVRQHGRAARATVESCAQCHDQSFCADCHAKTAATRIELKFSENSNSDFIHRGDYLTRHSLDARADQTLCQRCHGQSFCTQCHNAMNVGPGGENPRTPHPPGWSYPGPTSHAIPARRDIVACASCHEQGARSICIDCHRVGGMGGNPHPTRWSEKHDLAEARSKSMCLNCHQ
jgi:hypothetical protein